MLIAQAIPFDMPRPKRFRAVALAREGNQQVGPAGAEFRFWGVPSHAQLVAKHLSTNEDTDARVAFPIQRFRKTRAG